MTAVNPLLGGKYHYDTESQSFVSTEHMRIAQIIHDYNPELSIMWIPPAARANEDQKPYVLVHNQQDGSQYPVFYFTEDELDHRLLARVFAADMRNHHNADSVLSELDAQQAALDIIAAKKAEDERAERMDFAKSVLRSPLHTFRHGGKKVYG